MQLRYQDDMMFDGQRHRPLYAPLIAFCFCALILFLPPQAIAQTPSLETWNSRHYQIHTNLPRDQVIPYARHMDLVYAEFERRFANFQDRRRVVMPLYLVRTHDQYQHLLAGKGIDARNSAGIFFYRGREGGLASFIERDDLALALATLRHEAFHQFAHNYLGPTLPISINEGIAQYFENVIFAGDRMHMGLVDKRRLVRVQRMIAEERHLDLDTLLNITGEQWSATLRNEPQAAADLYAQSWALVYFLVHGDRRYVQAFERYLQQISRGSHSRQAMQRAFGTTNFAQAEPAWKRFMEQLEPDPATHTQLSMGFLARGLVQLQHRHRPMPTTLAELREALRAIGFHIAYSSHGIELTYHASDDQLYQYEQAPGQWLDFELLAAEAEGLPPVIAAPQARWRPQLKWSHNPNGQLVYEVVYQSGR